MLDKLKVIINEATWFLRNGVAPTKASNINKKKLEELNHMSSKKFAMTMIAVGVIAFMYFVSVLFLFFFPTDPHVSALVSMYKDMIFAVATIVGTLVGIQGFVDWKHRSDTSVTLSSEDVNEQQNEVHGFIDEPYFSCPKEKDYITKI